MTVLLADINDFAAVNEVYKEFFTSNYPARAAYQVFKISCLDEFLDLNDTKLFNNYHLEFHPLTLYNLLSVTIEIQWNEILSQTKSLDIHVDRYLVKVLVKSC